MHISWLILRESNHAYQRLQTRQWRHFFFLSFCRDNSHVPYFSLIESCISFINSFSPFLYKYVNIFAFVITISPIYHLLSKQGNEINFATNLMPLFPFVCWLFIVVFHVEIIVRYRCSTWSSLRYHVQLVRWPASFSTCRVIVHFICAW